MKKQLLFMCALCLSVAQAWAQPARAVHPPVKAEKLHRISSRMSDEEVRQGSTTWQATDSRAGESDTLLSVMWEESTFPITLPNTDVPPYTPAPAFPWSGEYTATLMIVDEGGDFSGDLQIMLYRYRWNAGGEASHRSDATHVTLPRGATQRATFTGRIEGGLPIDYIYTVQLIEQGGKVLDTKPYRASVVYPLAVVAEGTMLPRSMDLGEENVYTVRLRNEGNLDVSTNIVLQFLDLETKGLAGHGDMVAATIPHGGTADVPIHVSRGSNVTGLSEGSSYQMEVGFVEDRILYLVAFEDDSTGHVVEVHGYDLVLASDNAPPATILQHATDTFTVHLLNRGDRDFFGYVAMALADANGNNLYLSYAEGYGGLVEAGGEAYMDIPYNISNGVAPGSYYLMIYAGETMMYVVPAADDPAQVLYPVEVVYQPGPQLTVLYGESSFPAEVVQNSTFEVSLAIANTGEAAYEGEVWLTLNEVSGASRHTFDSIPVTIPVNDTVRMPFALTADIDLPRLRAETLYWYVHRSFGGGFSEVIAFDDPAWPSPASTIIQPNPDLQPVLTWVESQFTWPKTLTVGQRYTPSLQVKNAGKDFEGDLMFALVGVRVDEAAGIGYYEVRDHSPLVHVSFPRNGEQTVTFDYTVSDSIAPGQDYYIGLYQVADGEHHALYTDEGGAFMPVSVLPGETSGMQQPGDEAFTLYPNPATDRMTVTAPSGIGRVRLYSPCGTLVLDEPCDGHVTHDLRLGTLPSGIYLLQATTPEGIRTGRVVKRWRNDSPPDKKRGGTRQPTLFHPALGFLSSAKTC